MLQYSLHKILNSPSLIYYQKQALSTLYPPTVGNLLNFKFTTRVLINVVFQPLPSPKSSAHHCHTGLTNIRVDDTRIYFILSFSGEECGRYKGERGDLNRLIRWVLRR